jgi:hypothetical protein
MITKNKEEIEKIENMFLIEKECKYKNYYEEEQRISNLMNLKSELKATIKTSIQWCEGVLNLFPAIEQILFTNKITFFGLQKKKEQLQSHLEWLKQKEKEI